MAAKKNMKVEPEAQAEPKKRIGRPPKNKGPFAAVAETLAQGKQEVPKQFRDPSMRAQLLKLLKNELRITVEEGGMTNPNDRIVVVKLGDHVIDKASFNIKPRREYEG